MIDASGTSRNIKKERAHYSKNLFFKKWDYLVSAVFDNVAVPDVLLMVELGFTPTPKRCGKQVHRKLKVWNSRE